MESKLVLSAHIVKLQFIRVTTGILGSCIADWSDSGVTLVTLVEAIPGSNPNNRKRYSRQKDRIEERERNENTIG